MTKKNENKLWWTYPKIPTTYTAKKNTIYAVINPPITSIGWCFLSSNLDKATNNAKNKKRKLSGAIVASTKKYNKNAPAVWLLGNEESMGVGRRIWSFL